MHRDGETMLRNWLCNAIVALVLVLGHSEEAIGELVISCGDGAVDHEMAEHPLDAVALTIKPLVVADRLGAVRFRRDDSANAALREVVAGSWRPLRQVDQRVIAFAVCRFARCEVEGDRSPSGITETMNFTGEPAPRAAKSS